MLSPRSPLRKKFEEDAALAGNPRLRPAAARSSDHEVRAARPLIDGTPLTRTGKLRVAISTLGCSASAG
jgi:hypothetical protein